MKEDIYIEDESGDKKYFTMLPNLILNHSTAIDQALYCQLKKFAGENVVAFPSATTLMKKLGVTRNTIKKSINYLVKRGWIKEDGKREVMTSGGKQFVTAYKIIDIWKLNVEHYEKDYQNKIDLNEGVSTGGVNRGCQNSATNKNHLEEEPSKEDGVAIATSPKQQAQAFFLMVKENGEAYNSYLLSLKIPVDFARHEINKFTLYWTEKNSTGKKERWQMQTTFEVKRRLMTWFNNINTSRSKETKNKYQATEI